MKKSEIIKICEQKNVRFVHLQFTDLLGMVKSVTIPVKKLLEALNKNVWFDGSAIEGFARVFESDMYLKPDLNTFSLIPWENSDFRLSKNFSGENVDFRFQAISQNEAVARIICDIYLPSGEPFKGDPRYILKKQVEKAKKMGYGYLVGSELEFFLFQLNEKREPILTPHDSAGYFDYSIDRAAPLRHALSDAVSRMGVDVEAIHHEVAPGQHEVDFRHCNAVEQADRVITVKSTLKALARKFGLYASFMPKPITGIAGSGMHVHQSLSALTLGENPMNVFFDQKEKYASLSGVAKQFIAGQLKYMTEMAAITNPIVNSYKRLISGFEAPTYVAWGQMNRSALIRIPRVTEGNSSATRSEFRSPDSASNPYLVFACMLAAGLKGVEEKMEAPDPIDEDVYAFTDKKARRMRIRTLPTSLNNAVKQMEKSDLMKEVLGEHAFEKYLMAKKQEVEEYHREVCEWEVRRYFSVY